MDELRVGDTPFNVLMQQAVKMKTARHAVDRRRYDGLPRFAQNSMFGSSELQDKRSGTFAERLEVATRLKEEGNELFRSAGGPLECAMKYENALAIFRYIENTRPDWKKNCIDDDDMIYHDFLADEQAASSEEEIRQARRLCLSCYLNLAAAYMRTKDYKEAIHAADYALELDPKNAKALYRRAAARSTPMSAGATDLGLALKDLERAYRAAPADPAIRKAYNKLSSTLKKQKSSDKVVFGRLFERGEVYREQDVDEVERSRRANSEASRDTRPFEAQLREAQGIKKYLEDKGELDRAAEVHRVIEEAVTEHEKGRASKPRQIDWRNPTQEMIDDAEKQGIDLKDPRVVELLEEFEKEKRQGKGGRGGKAVPNLPAKQTGIVDWLLEMTFFQRSFLFGVVIFVVRLWSTGYLWKGFLLLFELIGFDGGDGKASGGWSKPALDATDKMPSPFLDPTMDELLMSDYEDENIRGL